jgi:uncharacterized protein
MFAPCAFDRDLVRPRRRDCAVELIEARSARMLVTASAIGDDTLQKRAQGYIVPDAFTHGSAEQRRRWFTTRLKTGALESCDTFSAAQP